MTSKWLLDAIREGQPLARDLREAMRVLPILEVGDFQVHVREYRDTALGIVLPVFQRLYDERVEELGGAGSAGNGDARLHVRDSIESAEQTTTKAIVVGLHHLFEQQRKKMLKESGGRLDRFQRLLQKRTGLDSGTWPCCKQLEDLRCTANVIKHASDRNVRELREQRPDLFRFGDEDLVSPALTDLGFYIPGEALEDWFDAVEALWTMLYEQLGDLARENPELDLDIVPKGN
jgi:hypothetical protein